MRTIKIIIKKIMKEIKNDQIEINK